MGKEGHDKLELEVLKQGQTRGYQSRVRVSRGSDKKLNPSIWTGAVMRKPPVNAERVKRSRPTD